MLDHAMAYAAKGYFVFPCRPKRKTPLTKNGHKDATTDEKTIRQWWAKWPDANIGLSVKLSALMVVDLDRHPGKPDGVKTFNEIKGKNSIELMPPRSNTGGNGIQLFFKCPEASLKSGLDGIDIKMDGYVIVPPSVHPNGPAYAWHKGHSLLECNPVDCPDWLLSAIIKEDFTAHDAERAFPKTYPASSGEAIIQRCPFMRHVAEDASLLPEPDWYHGIGVLAYTLESPEIVHQYSSLHPGYSANDTEAKLAHWKRDGKGPPTCRTIQDKCGDEHCKRCPYNGHIKSPIVLGYASQSVEPEKCLPPFPLEAMPVVFGNYTRHAAMAIQCPVDYIACALLAAVSILVGGMKRVQLEPEWSQQGNLWLTLVGSPSAKKTPAMDKAFSVLREIEQGLHADYKNERFRYDTQMKQYEIELRNWKKEPSGDPPVEPQKPKMKRLTTSDSTVEAVGELLANNPHGLGFVCDELSAWMRSMNQYKGGRGADRSHYLAMWSNTQMTIDRKKQEPIIVPAPYLAIVGSIQPDVLLEINNQGTEDGMKERFLFSCPPPNTEPPQSGRRIPPDVNAAMAATMRKIFEQRPIDPVTVNLSDDAQRVFLQARQEWHAKIQSESFPAEWEAYYAKMPGNLGRLALVLHEIKRASGGASPDILEATTMSEAKVLADYFLGHAVAALGMICKTREEKQVEKAIRWIQKHGCQVVAYRDFVTNKVAGCQKASQARNLLMVLADYGHGIWIEETKRLIVFQNFVSKSANGLKP